MAPPFRQRIEVLAITGEDVLSMTGVASRVNASRTSAKIRCPSPDHVDNDPSCSVDLATGKAFCHACGYKASDALGLYAAIGGFTSMTAAMNAVSGIRSDVAPSYQVTDRPPRSVSPPSWKPTGRRQTVKTWLYTDAASVPLFQVERIQSRLADGSWEHKPGHAKPYKTFVQAHAGGHPRGLPESLRQGGRPLYGLPRLLATPMTERVFVVEGEAAADALIGVGHPSTTSSGGASNARMTDWTPLAGRSIVIWPDNDDAGFGYADSVTVILECLTPITDVRVIDVAILGLPTGGDAVDWLQRRVDP
jgi:hypothetical protein